MGWNHRAIKTVYADGGESYAIHEVHYKADDDDTPWGMTAEPIAPFAESMEGLRWTLVRMLGCLDKPVLTEDDFPKAKQEKARKEAAG